MVFFEFDILQPNKKTRVGNVGHCLNPNFTTDEF